MIEKFTWIKRYQYLFKKGFILRGAQIFFLAPARVKCGLSRQMASYAPAHYRKRLKFVIRVSTIENRIYIRGEFKEALGMNFFSPFQPERKFKVYKSCNCSQIICSRVHKYSMFPRLFISISNFLKLLNKLYNELGE